MNDDELDAYITANAAALGLAIRPEWRDAVRANLAVTLRMAAMVEGVALEDEAEPGPVFRA
jgi:hypothetical protein